MNNEKYFLSQHDSKLYFQSVKSCGFSRENSLGWQQFTFPTKIQNLTIYTYKFEYSPIIDKLLCR